MRILLALLWVCIAATALDAQQVFKAGDEGVTRPRLLKHVPIEYSEEARQAKLEGTVNLIAVIRADGSVANVEVTKALGAGMDEKAVEAVKQWRFKAAKKNGDDVAFEACVTISFRLL